MNEGASELYDGADALAEGTGEMLTGVQQLYDSKDGLLDGTQALDDGAKALLDGILQLDDGAQALFGGAEALYDGMATLREGIRALDDEAVEKLIEFIGDDFPTISDRADAMLDMMNGYPSYSGRSEDMTGVTAFVIRTEAVESDEAE